MIKKQRKKKEKPVFHSEGKAVVALFLYFWSQLLVMEIIECVQMVVWFLHQELNSFADRRLKLAVKISEKGSKLREFSKLTLSSLNIMAQF